MLGGGLVPGSVVLLGGEPGMGKSTLLLQLAAMLAAATAPGRSAGSSSSELDDVPLALRRVAAASSSPPPPKCGWLLDTLAAAAGGLVLPPGCEGRPVLYVTAEESAGQVAERAARLGLAARPAAAPGARGSGGGGSGAAAAAPGAALDVRLLVDNRVEAVAEAAAELRPAALIVDSIQTVTLADVPGRPGSVSQVRAARCAWHSVCCFRCLVPPSVAALPPVVFILTLLPFLPLPTCTPIPPAPLTCLNPVAIFSRPPTPPQVRECATFLLHVSKSLGCATLLVGHVTKGGGLAGPKHLEHLVDVVLQLSGGGTGGAGSLRALRALKNRHGRVGEVGLFEMQRGGLEADADPGARLLAATRDSSSSSSGGEGAGPAVGTAVTVLLDGVRPLPLELQALAEPPERGDGAAAAASSAPGAEAAWDDATSGWGGGMQQAGGDDSEEEWREGGTGGAGADDGSDDYDDVDDADDVWDAAGAADSAASGNRRPSSSGGRARVPLRRYFSGWSDARRVDMLLSIMARYTRLRVRQTQSRRVEGGRGSRAAVTPHRHHRVAGLWDGACVAVW